VGAMQNVCGVSGAKRVWRERKGRKNVKA